MKSMSVKQESLLARVEEVERQNRRLKSVMLLLACSLAILVLMGAKAAVRDGHFRQLAVEKITIVDSSGQERMIIGSFQDRGTGIRIMNKSGNRVLGLGITADEGGSGILVADANGKPRLGLGLDKGVPSLAMADANGRKVIALGGDDSGYGLVIMDENEVERAGVGFKQGNTGIVLYDSDGKYVRGMIREANGSHFSSFVDENGNEIFTE